MKAQSGVLVILAVIVLAWWGWIEFRPEGTGSAPPAPDRPEGVNRLAGTTTLNRDWSPLGGMQWDDIAPTAATFGGQDLLARRFLEETGTMDSQPVIYLRGLVALSLADPEAAAVEFSRIEPGGLPAGLLYAPWRLIGDIRRGSANPFDAPILAAAGEGKLEPLLAARVYAFNGRFPESLAQYLQSDPSRWADFDLECFQLMMRDEAVKNDTGTLLLAAFRGGRLPDSFRPGAARLLLNRGENTGDPAPVLRKWIEENPQARGIAEQALVSLLEDRKLFVEERFPELLARHRDTDAAGLINESVILLVIASSSPPGNPDFQKWAQELERRFPQPEVTAWLESLRNDRP